MLFMVDYTNHEAYALDSNRNEIMNCEFEGYDCEDRFTRVRIGETILKYVYNNGYLDHIDIEKNRHNKSRDPSVRDRRKGSAEPADILLVFSFTHAAAAGKIPDQVRRADHRTAATLQLPRKPVLISAIGKAPFMIYG